MKRLIIQAVLSAAVAAFLLAQLHLVSELLAWEGLLLVLLIWQVFEVPGSGESLAPRLFGSARSRATRLPRSLLSIELSMIDVIAGYVSPERRIRPMLRRLAAHRLRRHGLAIDAPGAVKRLGEDNWRWLSTTSDEMPDSAGIAGLVRKLEAL